MNGSFILEKNKQHFKMKFLLLGVFALCAVSLGEVIGSSEIPNAIGHTSAHQGPYSLKLTLSDEEQHFVDNHILLEEQFGRNVIADVIQNALEDFRDVVINGNESVPPLDPFVVDTIGPLEFDITGVRATASVNDFRAEGLRWYVVDYVNFNALRLAFGAQVTLPWLTVTGTYDAEARVALLLNHRAAGNFRVFINRFELGVDIRLGTNLLGGHLLLRDLDIRLDIADVLIQIDGMTGSSFINSFINSFVQSLTQDVIQNHLGDISKMISEEVFDAVNDFLKDYTLSDILG